MEDKEWVLKIRGNMCRYQNIDEVCIALRTFNNL